MQYVTEENVLSNSSYSLNSLYLFIQMFSCRSKKIWQGMRKSYNNTDVSTLSKSLLEVEDFWW